MRRLLFLSLLFVLLIIPHLRTRAQPQVRRLGLNHATFVVKLTAPISTRTSRRGDTFAALVELPPQYIGAVVSGRITKLMKPKKGVAKGRAEIAFQFESLYIRA